MTPTKSAIQLGKIDVLVSIPANSLDSGSRNRKVPPGPVVSGMTPSGEIVRSVDQYSVPGDDGPMRVVGPWIRRIRFPGANGFRSATRTSVSPALAVVAMNDPRLSIRPTSRYARFHATSVPLA